MRYAFVERHRGRWPVRLMCRVLGVSPGGYYDWRRRPASRTAQRREAPVADIKAVHGEVKARYDLHGTVYTYTWDPNRENDTAHAQLQGGSGGSAGAVLGATFGWLRIHAHRTQRVLKT